MLTDATEPFSLEKLVWTEADFEQMNWHDVHIHAFAFRADIFEFWLDLDYIFKWIHPLGDETKFSFWLAPATLVFTNVYGFKIEIDSPDGDLSLQGISRSELGLARNFQHLEKKTESLWLLDLNEGEIAFHSVGFSQFTRRPPAFRQAQRLTLKERGGISFSLDYAT